MRAALSENSSSATVQPGRDCALVPWHKHCAPAGWRFLTYTRGLSERRMQGTSGKNTYVQQEDNLRDGSRRRCRSRSGHGSAGRRRRDRRHRLAQRRRAIYPGAFAGSTGVREGQWVYLAASNPAIRLSERRPRGVMRFYEIPHRRQPGLPGGYTAPQVGVKTAETIRS